jgi:hypothetical protein
VVFEQRYIKPTVDDMKMSLVSPTAHVNPIRTVLLKKRLGVRMQNGRSLPVKNLYKFNYTCLKITKVKISVKYHFNLLL